jgi:hypothetical protein
MTALLLRKFQGRVLSVVGAGLVAVGLALLGWSKALDVCERQQG